MSNKQEWVDRSRLSCQKDSRWRLIVGLKYQVLRLDKTSGQIVSVVLKKVNIILFFEQPFFVVTTTITLHLSLRIHERFVLKCKIDRVNFNEPIFIDCSCHFLRQKSFSHNTNEGKAS